LPHAQGAEPQKAAAAEPPKPPADITKLADAPTRSFPQKHDVPHTSQTLSLRLFRGNARPAAGRDSEASRLSLNCFGAPEGQIDNSRRTGSAGPAYQKGLLVMNRPTSFRLHIRPLLRDDPDVEHMKDLGVDLSSYDVVRQNSANILARLKARDRKMMPPASTDGPWPDEWIALFERWINEGHPQ